MQIWTPVANLMHTVRAQRSAQGQSYSSRFLFFFPIKYMHRSGLQQAPQLCRLRQEECSVQQVVPLFVTPRQGKLHQIPGLLCSLPELRRTVKECVGSCWHLPAHSTGLIYWLIGVYSRSHKVHTGLARWFTAFSTILWTDPQFGIFLDWSIESVQVGST